MSEGKYFRRLGYICSPKSGPDQVEKRGLLSINVTYEIKNRMKGERGT